MTNEESGAQWGNVFAGASVDAMRAYDQILARLFTPFAHDLIKRLAPSPGCEALDVACGPGTVTHLLAARIGVDGRVVATDISPSMLAIGRAKPASTDAARIEWVESPAEPLPLPDASFDVIACQQGLQFFPDKTAALAEMRRVLRPGGRAAVAIWTEVENQVFGYLRDAIANTVSPETGARYNGPFSLTGEAAAQHAREAGFTEVDLSQVTLPAVLSGPAELVGTLPAAGIAAEIAALDDEGRTALLAEVDRLTAPVRNGEEIRSSLTTSFLLLS